MGFGRNPHVAKAAIAEQKAVDARDDAARTSAYRDAAHQWDRAAERERPGKTREEYDRNAARNRALADGEPIEHTEHTEHTEKARPAPDDERVLIEPRFLN